MPEHPDAKQLLFLDSSVFIAATLSATGGSFRLLKEANHGNVRIVTNEYVIEEITRVLQQRYPDKLFHFRRLLDWSTAKIMPLPPTHIVKRYLNVINIEDAPILAGALIAKTNFLVTLDRKDFIQERLRKAKPPFIIVTPQDFFQQHWQ